MVLPENQQLHCWWGCCWGWRSKMLRLPWKTAPTQQTHTHKITCIQADNDIKKAVPWHVISWLISTRQRSKDPVIFSKFPSIIYALSLFSLTHTHTQSRSRKRTVPFLLPSLFLLMLRYKNIPWRGEVVIAGIKPPSQYLSHTGTDHLCFLKVCLPSHMVSQADLWVWDLQWPWHGHIKVEQIISLKNQSELVSRMK